MDLHGYLPIIVALGILGFLLGNIFALKPKAYEVRTADFRLLARQFGINPKLITRPNWLPAKPQKQNHHTAKTDFVAMYAMVRDDWRLPMVRFVRVDGVWQGADDELATLIENMPKTITDHAVGLQFKANSVALYWADAHYQSSQGMHQLDINTAKMDLQKLCQALNVLGDFVNARK
ncbi:MULTISPECIES: hypothetical protein [unclassified Moraxella]|uniref:hypothetical protein n=1 Tax=unclassified Moraxella TaxID=2685852 RepID=UPI002B4108DD|nr:MULTISPECIES: hypothetical protein [unclassified Moraxella]